MGEQTHAARVAIVGPVYPFRAGVAYCTTRLAEELHADVISFARQYPKRLYPGGDDIDPTLPRADAAFILDILNPLTWLRARRRLRDYDAVIFVWWIWVWAIPYRLMMIGLRRVILQCHNIGEKEPAWWKRALTNIVLRRANVLVVHANSEAEEAWRRTHRDVVKAFLPVHEIGAPASSPAGPPASRRPTALFFGHIRPFKGLDIALEAWKKLKTDVTLVVAGEPWFGFKPEPQPNVRFDLRFIPDAEVAKVFEAADVVIAPYRAEAQSGVAMTAFHFGKPVIATRVGGLPDIIDDRNGILIPPEDPDALARAVDEFFTTRDRAAMGRAAAESGRRFSWAEYGAIISRLVQRP
jgi:glycosyltransferase involved in cell wall biosynthesis